MINPIFHCIIRHIIEYASFLQADATKGTCSSQFKSTPVVDADILVCVRVWIETDFTERPTREETKLTRPHSTRKETGDVTTACTVPLGNHFILLTG